MRARMRRHSTEFSPRVRRLSLSLLQPSRDAQNRQRSPSTTAAWCATSNRRSGPRIAVAVRAPTRLAGRREPRHRCSPRSPSGASNLINRNLKLINPHQPESSQSLQQPSTARIISHQPALVLPVHSVARALSSCCRQLACMATDPAYIYVLWRSGCRSRSRDARSA